MLDNILRKYGAMEYTDIEMAEMTKSSCALYDKCHERCLKRKRFNKPYWFADWVEGEPEKKTRLAISCPICPIILHIMSDASTST